MVGRLAKRKRHTGEFKLNTEQSILSGKEEDRQSVFGIVSLISGLLAFLFLLMDFGLFYYGIYIDPTGRTIPPLFLDGNFLLFANSLPIFFGIVFGVIGLFQKNRRKTLAILGLMLSGITGVVLCVSLAWLVVQGLSGV
jgi:hypothetical protein